MLDLREGEKYIANLPGALRCLVRHTSIRSCFSSAFQISSFDLIRLSQREAADRRTRKFSRTGIHGGPSSNCGAASFFFAGTATDDYRPG